MRLIAVAAAAVLLGTGGATATTPALLVSNGAAWSPDGSTIAFAGWASGSNRIDIYTIRPDGSGLRNLTADDTRSNLYDPKLPADHFNAAWSSDGRLSYVTALGAYNAPAFGARVRVRDDERGRLRQARRRARAGRAEAFVVPGRNAAHARDVRGDRRRERREWTCPH